MTKIPKNGKKTKNNIEQAVESVMTDIYKSLTPETVDRQIFGEVLKLLSEGYPVKPHEIANNIQTTSENVISTVRRFGTEFDNEGNILGLGLTLVPTPHLYKSNGHSLYTWCAADALSFPVILGQVATVESHDPVTGEKVSLRVTPDIVESVEPKSAVVSLVKNIDTTNVRRSGCNKINFFASPKSASKWIEKYPDMMFYPVSEIYQALRQIHLSKYSDLKVDNKQQRMCC